MVEWLQPGDIAELFFQQAVDPVDGEVLVGAGQRQVLILVAGEAALLEVDDQRVSHQEVSPQDGLVDIGDREVPDEALPGALQGDHPGTIAVCPGSTSTYQVRFRSILSRLT